MRDLVARVAEIFHGVGWWWGLGISLLAFAGSLAVVTVIVVGWPADQFKSLHRPPFWSHRHPLVRALGLVAKNIAGVLLVLLGIIMALPGVPGQGVLTALIGLTLVDFPGKRRLEIRLIRRPTILHAVNALRARFHKPALELG